MGEDFPRRYLQLFRRHRIDLDGLQIAPGKTFHWAGQYEVNMNNRRTLKTELGVFERFLPVLPPAYQRTPFVLLGNIAPALQHHVLDQLQHPKFVLADTMDLWLNAALDDLLRLIKRVDALVVNDSEARQLTGLDNVVAATRQLHRLGPRFVIVKKGEHGALLSAPGGLFLCPAYPLARVVDPTGAGDSFAGGLLGWLASRRGNLETNLRQGMIYGSVVASFCCEGFGVVRTARLTRAAIDQRVAALRRLAKL